MKLGEKIFKAVSYGFIVFIVGIIVLTFGMPEFMDKAGDSDKFLAAKVGSELITRKEVQNMKMNMLRLPQFQNFASQEEFLNRYALDYLISEKLAVISQKNNGIYPLSDAKSSLVARYLKKNFKEFQTNEGFDFTRFEKEFMKPRRIIFSDIESQVVRESVYNNRQLIEKLETVSNYEQEDSNLLKNSKISYEILVITPDQKKNILKNMIGITEKDIVAKFTKDYLSKDKKDTLTDLKREAITQSLITEKRAKVEKEWLTNLKKEAQSSTIDQLSKKYGGIYLFLKNIGLTESLHQAAKNEKANLNLLEESSDFINGLAQLKTDKILGPWNIEDHMYLVSLGNITKPNNNLLAIHSTESASEIKNKNKSAADKLMDDILRRDNKISKFAHSED